MLSYVGEDEDEEQSSDTGDDLKAVITTDLSHLHALAGGSKSRPFNVIGTIGTTTISILIDTGSNHDFLHPRIAEQLHTTNQIINSRGGFPYGPAYHGNSWSRYSAWHGLVRVLG